MIGDALYQAQAGLGDDELDAGEAVLLEMVAEARPAFAVLLGTFADAEELPGSPQPRRLTYGLFLQSEGIEHKSTGIGRLSSNGIIKRLHRMPLAEHLRVQGRTDWHDTVKEMQTALDASLLRYNRDQPHQRRGMGGPTPTQALLDGPTLKLEPSQETEIQAIAA